MRQKAGQGFSLIELLIVIAIVGILASVGFASYESYAIKVRMSEAQRYALALTVQADGFYQENGKFPGLTAAERAIVPIPSSEFMRGYSFWSNGRARTGRNGVVYERGTVGTVQIYFNEEVYPGATDKVRLTYDYLPDAFGNGSWLCVKHFVSSLVIDAEYLPDGCDNTMRFR